LSLKLEEFLALKTLELRHALLLLEFKLGESTCIGQNSISAINMRNHYQ
jgi:hypothetical protein